MKKLLYTLFAFAIIVACEKDMDDNYGSSSISPIETEVSNLDFNSDIIINSVLERWGVNGITSAPSSKGASTAKTNNPSAACATDDRVAPDASTDYISYEILSDSDGHFGLIRSEERSNAAAFDAGQLIVTLYFTRQANDVTHIYVGANKVAEFTSNGFDGLYDIANALAVESLTSGFIYTGDTTTTAAGLDCTAVSAPNWVPGANGLFSLAGVGSYQVTDAPFPLTGKLATVMSKDDSANVVANYAGTDEAAVNTAIRADFVD